MPRALRAHRRDAARASACSAKVVVADAARPAALVGRRALRRHPARRALHRLGHRAPPSRRALAAPRERHRAARARSRRCCWPRCGRCSRPGGRLLYCTCSVFRDEGAHQIEAFLAHNTDARLLPSPGHLLPQSGVNARGVPDNALGDHDGFFYALLEKRAALNDAGRRWLAALLVLAGSCALAAWAGAGATPRPRRVTQLRLEQADDGVYLTAAGPVRAAAGGRRGARQGHRRSISWPRPSCTANAGTGPTSKVAQAPRHMRLAYQPLTPPLAAQRVVRRPSPTQASASR